MSFLKKIENFFNPPGPSRAPDFATWITVKCSRCGEVIRSRIDLRNDLTIDYGADGASTTYYCHKTLIGEQRCYQRIEVDLTFDAKHKLTGRQISGGEFLEENKKQAAA